MALLLLAATTNPARADCPAAPIADSDDMAISFLAANGVQAASASLLASTVKEGTLVYDDTADKLKVCDGTNWVDVGSGSGTDTLAALSCTTGQIAKFDGTDWVCAADGGGGGDGTPLHTQFSTIIAQVTGAAAGSTNSSTVSCPADTTLISYGVQGHNTGLAGGAGWNYCNCTKSGNGIYATITNSTANANYACKCDGLCLSDDAVNGGSSDTLSGLSCSTNEIPKWDGTAWACAPDGNDGGASMTGAVMAFNASTCPTGWTEYTPARGRFLRGIDPSGSTTVDPDGTRAPGNTQADEIAAHAHGLDGRVEGLQSGASNSRQYVTSGAIGTESDTNSKTAGGAETRPKNVAVIFCQYNGTGGLGGGSGGTEVAFAVYRGTSNASISSATETVVDWNAEDLDTNSNFDLTTDRFTPTVAGKYIVHAGVTANNVVNSGTAQYVTIYKNGTRIVLSYGTGSGNSSTASTSALVDMNGTTDYLEVRYYDASASPAIYSGSKSTYFNGALLGGGSGSDTLAGLSCATNEIPKWNGTAWACAADGGGSGVTPVAASAAISSQNTSSTTITDMAGASVTFTSNGLPTLVMANFTTFSNTVNATGTFQLVIDGTVESTFTQQYVNGGDVKMTTLQTLKTLSAGSHTAKIRWMTNTGTLTANWNSGTTSIIVHEIGGGGGSGSDTLAGLSCSAGEVPEWDGSAWTCGTGSGGGSSGFVDGLAVDAQPTGTLSSACPTYVDVPSMSKTITVPQSGDALINFSQVFYVTGTGGGVTYRFCADSTCTSGLNYYSNELSSHKTAAGSWKLPLSAGTYTGKLQYCKASGTTINTNASGSASWSISMPGAGGSGSGGGGPVPSFHVNKAGTNQTVSAAESVITWPNDSTGSAFDSNNNFASNRFTPTVAGKYLITLSTYVISGVHSALIYKNNTLVAGKYASASNTINTTTTIVDMNGSTDYIEARIIAHSGTVLEGLAEHTFMTGTLLGAGGGGSGTPGGDDTEVQFNDGGAFAGSDNFTFDKTANSNEGKLTIGSATAITAGAADASVAVVDVQGVLTSNGIAMKKIAGADAPVSGGAFATMTSTARDALTGVPEGRTIYNTTTHRLEFFNGTTWQALTATHAILNGTSSAQAALNCKDILDNGYSTGTGTYWIDPDGAGSSESPIEVTCDMTTEGGGWTHIPINTGKWSTERLNLIAETKEVRFTDTIGTAYLSWTGTLPVNADYDANSCVTAGTMKAGSAYPPATTITAQPHATAYDGAGSDHIKPFVCWVNHSSNVGCNASWGGRSNFMIGYSAGYYANNCASNALIYFAIR